MAEYMTTVNTIWQYKIPFSILVASRYHSAEMVLFDVHQLLIDIYHNPTEYLTAPANVTGFVDQCNLNGTVCHNVGDIDSYMWYDELHSSQGTDKVIATDFIKVVEGNSKYASYWSASGGRA